MRNTIRFAVTLAAFAFFAGAVGFAQSGEATYKAKCANCHGATGMADAGMGKIWKMKPATDPSVKSMTAAQMIATTTNGMPKMPAFKGKLSDAEIKAAVEYFRTFAK